MTVLLTHGYFIADDPKEQVIMRPYPPLGLLYVAGHLREVGHDVRVYDSTFGSFDAVAIDHESNTFRSGGRACPRPSRA